MDTPLKTAEELAEQFTRDNPGRRFAVSPSGNAIAVWDGDTTPPRWRLFVAKLLPCVCMARHNGDRCQCLTGWARMPELLVNGKSLVEQADWREHPKPAAAGERPT